MKKINLYFVTIFLLISSSVFAQRFFSVSTGIGIMFNDSEDLTRFQNTYNQVNIDNLAILLSGLSGAMGLRYHVTYRQIDRFSFAFSIGKQSYGKSDFAQFTNGESRNLTLKMKSTIIELEAGRKIKQLFLNGLVTFYLNRKISIRSSYTGESSVASKKALNGFFESHPQLSADFGFCAGFYKEPLIFTLRISYPIYTGGKEGYLYDNSRDNIQSRSNIFPRDYWDYHYGGTITGVRSNIDGLKIGFSVAFALPI